MSVDVENIIVLSICIMSESQDYSVAPQHRKKGYYNEFDRFRLESTIRKSF
jgi:hypothetical protein